MSTLIDRAEAFLALAEKEKELWPKLKCFLDKGDKDSDEYIAVSTVWCNAWDGVLPKHSEPLIRDLLAEVLRLHAALERTTGAAEVTDTHTSEGLNPA